MSTHANPIERVFALQQAHQWEAKASTGEERKEKLRKLKAAVEAWPDVVARLRGLRELAWPARRAPVGPEAPATP